ncbi:hypothetical protein AB0I35_05415 [Nocardia sp. NPDC050378]|uniref:hypothetical protein n=1 Tax=Nocardia sp. NPDC050378 TaxID=3155400 RepID=UPI0033F659E9
MSAPAAGAFSPLESALGAVCAMFAPSSALAAVASSPASGPGVVVESASPDLALWSGAVLGLSPLVSVPGAVVDEGPASVWRAVPSWPGVVTTCGCPRARGDGC